MNYRRTISYLTIINTSKLIIISSIFLHRSFVKIKNDKFGWEYNVKAECLKEKLELNCKFYIRVLYDKI